MTSCKYRRGDAYTYNYDNDSVKYVIRNQGNGRKISKKIEGIKRKHESREDVYKFIYVSDSIEIAKNGSVILYRVLMPDYENDLLSKGYLGATGTTLIATYFFVTKDDFDANFTEIKEEE